MWFFLRRNELKCYEVNQADARCDNDGPFCLHFYAPSREITGSSIVCVLSCFFIYFMWVFVVVAVAVGFVKLLCFHWKCKK